MPSVLRAVCKMQKRPEKSGHINRMMQNRTKGRIINEVVNKMGVINIAFMNKKVLFLRPYYGFNIHSDAHGELGMLQVSYDVYPDLTFLTAASVFSESGDYQVRVIDAALENRMLPDELLKQLENDIYNLVILKTTGQTIHSDLKLLEAVRGLMPEADIKICGLAAKILKKWLTGNAPYISEVIEEPVDEYALRYVKNINNGFIHLPAPDYTLVNYKGYRDRAKGLRLTLTASRGCPMSCLYCPYKLYYEGYRTKSAEAVIGSMEKLMELEPDEIQFRDQYFSADKNLTKELLKGIIDRGIRTRIVCETRMESLDEEILQLMKDAGVGMICFGVESADAGVLSNYNSVKGDLRRVKELIDHAHLAGIETMAFYIVGFPEETWEMAGRTYELAEYLDTTYVHFNEYEHCRFGIGDAEYTPDLFLPFGNVTALDYPSVLNADEREYLAYIFELRYTMRTSVQDSYRYRYKLFNEYKNAVGKLRPLATDLYRLSECVRDMRAAGSNDPDHNCCRPVSAV